MSANEKMPMIGIKRPLTDNYYKSIENDWLNSLQPCEISESELEKVKKKLVISGYVLSLDTIEVTDIISDNNGVITFKEKEQRYIVDIRSGCGAVIDTKHEDYDKDYPGLHQDTSGVVEYKHGFRSTDGWDMKKEDVDYLNNLCYTLNKQPKQVEEIEAVYTKKTS